MDVLRVVNTATCATKLDASGAVCIPLQGACYGQRLADWSMGGSLRGLCITRGRACKGQPAGCSMITTMVLTERGVTPRIRCSTVAAAAAVKAAHTTAPLSVAVLSSRLVAEGDARTAGKAVCCFDAPSSSETTDADPFFSTARRVESKTSRRTALAISVALVGLTHHRCQFFPQHGAEQGHSSSPTQGVDFISVSPHNATGVPSPVVPAASLEGYGDLVTVSTGSPRSLHDGAVKGLPSWMRGNYHLCLGDGFHVQLPADWHMRDSLGQVYGTVLRYEHRLEPSTNAVVLKCPTSSQAHGDEFDEADWIKEQAYLLAGNSNDEPPQAQVGINGHDLSMKAPSSTMLNVDKPTNKQGLTYFNYELVTTQCGQQGNTLHELVTAVVNNGDLYMCRVQTEEGRWQESTQAMARRIVDSFQITGFKIRT